MSFDDLLHRLARRNMQLADEVDLLRARVLQLESELRGARAQLCRPIPRNDAARARERATHVYAAAPLSEEEMMTPVLAWARGLTEEEINGLHPMQAAEVRRIRAGALT